METVRSVSELLDNGVFDEIQSMLPVRGNIRKGHHYDGHDKFVLCALQIDVPFLLNGGPMPCVGLILDRRRLCGSARLPLFVDAHGCIYSYDPLERTLCFRAASLSELVLNGMWKDDHTGKTHYPEGPDPAAFQGLVDRAVAHSPHRDFVRDTEVNVALHESSVSFLRGKEAWAATPNQLPQSMIVGGDFDGCVNMTDLPCAYTDLLSLAVLASEGGCSLQSLVPAYLMRTRGDEIYIVFKRLGPSAFYLYHPSGTLFAVDLNEHALACGFAVQHHQAPYCRVEPGVKARDLALLLRKMWTAAHATESPPSQDESKKVKGHRKRLVESIQALISTSEKSPEARERDLHWIGRSIRQFFGAGMTVFAPRETKMRLYFPTALPTDPHCSNLLALVGARIKLCAGRSAGSESPMFLGVTLAFNDLQGTPRLGPVLTFYYEGLMYHLDSSGTIERLGTVGQYFGMRPYVADSTWDSERACALSLEDLKILQGYVLNRTVEFFQPALTSYLFD